MFNYVYTPSLWAVGGSHSRRMRHNWVCSKSITQTQTHRHTQAHTHKQRDYNKYPTSHTLLCCITSVWCSLWSRNFIATKLNFIVLPSFLHWATSFYSSFGKTIATSSISHLNLRLNCWQSGCTVGNVDIRFWQRGGMLWKQRLYLWLCCTDFDTFFSLFIMSLTVSGEQEVKAEDVL